MKNIVFISSMVFLLSAFTGEEAEEVYVCTSTSSKKYHLKKSCRGLVRCKATVKKTSLAKAKKYGRTLCKWEKKMKK